MNFTNINDPAGVKALLDQLRSSQAWQETITVPESTSITVNSSPLSLTPPTRPPDSAVSSSSSTPTVAALLSQLQQQQPTPSSWSSESVAAPSSAVADSPPLPSPPRPPVRKDVRRYTFQQAMPCLATLANEPSFIASLVQMKQEQANLEKQLWEERCAIQRKYEEKVKVARTKASMLGVSISKHEADMILCSFQKETNKFDSERALLAWDGLVERQQAALEALGVPTMFVTDAAGDREGQQRVVRVLEGIAGGDELV